MLLQSAAHRIETGDRDFDPLIDLAGDSGFVLLGEASHGTHEFYSTRAAITKRLIQEKGFHAVAVEADWPDAHRVNRYLRGRSEDQSAEQALGGFSRFPAWIGRNEVVSEFITWLRHHNQAPGTAHPVGFYGLDLYSLHQSRAEVVRYLERVDAAAAQRARERYACFDHFRNDEQAYGQAAGFGLSASCEQEVLQQLA